MKKLSFIIPCYNSEKSINKCLTSIIKQQYNDYEIICLNDGSSDNTLSLIYQFQKKHSNIDIQIFSHTNQGVSYTRNRGIDLSSGKYIIFIDPDDYLIQQKNFLSKAVKKMEDNPQIDYFGYKGILNIEKHKVFLPLTPSNNHIFNDPVFYLKHNIAGFIWRGIYKASIIKQHKIKFPNYKIGEDIFFNLNYFLKANKFYFSNYYFIVYCLHDKNISMSDYEVNCVLVNEQILSMVQLMGEIIRSNHKNCVWIKNQKDLDAIFKYIFWYNVFVMVGWEKKKCLEDRFLKIFFTDAGKKIIKDLELENTVKKIARPLNIWQLIVYWQVRYWNNQLNFTKKFKK